MNSAGWAARYCEKGLALTWVPPGQKGPRHHEWQKPANAFTDPEQARRFWRANPSLGMACLLAPSGLVSIDVDELEASRKVFASLGVDLDHLCSVTPMIRSRPGRCRLMFRAPLAELRHRSAVWPAIGDPRRRKVLFELRAGTIADTLPPTVHPDTGRPYAWVLPSAGGLPDLPVKILELWLDWSQTEKRILAACPWAPPPAKSEPRRKTPARRSEESVIDAFNAAHDVAAVLEEYGYTRQGRRFSAPDSAHAAGIVLLGDGRVFCHHVGDILGDGKPHDAFDVWRLLDHGGDLRSAVKAAARLLGLDRQKAAA